MDALGKFGEHSKKLEFNTLTLLSCSPNFPRASITRYSCFDKGCPTKSVKAYATMPIVIMGSKSLTLLD